MMSEHEWIRIAFDGPPSHESGRFVEVETEHGNSISFGEWVEGENGLWYLQFPNHANEHAALKRENKRLLKGIKMAHLHLLASRCECGEPLKETDAFDCLDALLTAEES